MKKNKLIKVSFFGSLLFLAITNVYAAPSWLGSGSKVSCGNIGDIPAKVPEIVHMFILIAQIAVPILLVILGMMDFVKGIMSQKEDEIKKGQQTFVKRLIMGAIIFFVVALVKLLVSVVVDSSDNRDSIFGCIDCFINNECDGVTNVSGGGGGGSSSRPDQIPSSESRYEQLN